MRFTLLALGFFLMACNEEPPIEPYTGPIDPYVGTVKMWVEDNHFNLPKEEAVKGCEFWAPKGVSCELTDNQESANVKVKLDPDMPTNGTFLAWAYSSGLIILYPHGPTWFTEDGEIDGSQVFDFFLAGKYKEIYEYCKRDVQLTRQVYNRMLFKDK